MSPDWAAKAEPVPYAKMDDPQSLNLYAYVGNNPLGRFDADGHDWEQVLGELAGAPVATGLALGKAGQIVMIGYARSLKVKADMDLIKTDREIIDYAFYHPDKVSPPAVDQMINQIREAQADAMVNSLSIGFLVDSLFSLVPGSKSDPIGAGVQQFEKNAQQFSQANQGPNSLELARWLGRFDPGGTGLDRSADTGRDPEAGTKRHKHPHKLILRPAGPDSSSDE